MSIILNGQVVNTFNFSGGECHVNISSLAISKNVEIIAILNSSDAIMQLLLTVDAARRINELAIINLVIPYFPYARQDRVCNYGEALSVEVMANLINGLNCNSVTVYDPHSQIVQALIRSCIVVSSADIIGDNLADEIKSKNLTLVSPDAGARKKTEAIAQRLFREGVSENIIYAQKVRNSQTGEIVETRLEKEAIAQDCIIVDDICDGGRTFIELAKSFKI